MPKITTKLSSHTTTFRIRPTMAILTNNKTLWCNKQSLLPLTLINQLTSPHFRSITCTQLQPNSLYSLLRILKTHLLEEVAYRKLWELSKDTFSMAAITTIIDLLAYLRTSTIITITIVILDIKIMMGVCHWLLIDSQVSPLITSWVLITMTLVSTIFI